MQDYKSPKKTTISTRKQSNQRATAGMKDSAYSSAKQQQVGKMMGETVSSGGVPASVYQPSGALAQSRDNNLPANSDLSELDKSFFKCKSNKP